MRNFKKLFALVLAGAMAFGLTAGAFSDNKAIKNSKAVNTMSAVGIINGYTDGSFRPENIVTRAEMAKMIYVLKNGGKDDGASYYAGIKTNLSDTKGHWAEGYINYCFTLGIIAGMGDGTFKPDAPVTGLQAAKMLLVVLGYNAEKAELVGNRWNLKTAALASEKGLFEDYSPALDAGTPRDFAALMMYNSLYAQMVTFDDGSFKDMTNGAGEPITIGSKYLALQTDTGILLSAGGVSIDGGTKDKNIVRVKDSSVSQFKFETDSNLLGQEVTIVYREAEKVYDLYATDKNVVHDLLKNEVTVNKADKSKIKFDGYNLTDNEGMLILTNLTGTAAKQNADGDDDFSTLFTENDGGSVRFIDNNDDGKFEYALITDKTFSKVSAVSDKGITIIGIGTGEIENDNIITNDKLEKDDYVLCFKDGSDRYVVEKVEPIRAKIDGTRGNNQIYADGNFYKQSSTAPTSNIGLDIAAGTSAMSIGNVYDIYLYGNCWIGAKSVETVSDNYALLIGQSGSVDGVTELQVRLLLSDNTKKTYNVNTDKTSAALISDGALNGTTGVTVYAYNVNDDGTVTLEAVAAGGNLSVGNTPASADTAAKYIKDDKRISINNEHFFINDDTVIFVKYEAQDSSSAPNYSYKAVKASELVANLSFGAGENLTAPVAYQYAYTTSSGIKTLKMVVLDLGTNELSMSTGTYFAFSTQAEYILSENGKNNAVYTIWDGEKEVEIQAKDVTSSSPEVDFTNKFIKYSLSSDGNVEKRISEAAEIGTTIADASSTNLTKASVRAYDGSKWIMLAETENANGKYFEITEDTIIHYINMEDNEGITNGSIEVLEDNTIMNAMFALDDDGKIGHLFIATKGEF